MAYHVRTMIFKIEMFCGSFAGAPWIDEQCDIAILGEILTYKLVVVIELSISGMAHHDKHRREWSVAIWYIKIGSSKRIRTSLEGDILELKPFEFGGFVFGIF